MPYCNDPCAFRQAVTVYVRGHLQGNDPCAFRQVVTVYVRGHLQGNGTHWM